LKYEHDTYAEALEHMPLVGSLVETEDGNGKVVEVNPLIDAIRVELQNKTVKVFESGALKVLKEPHKSGHNHHKDFDGLDEETLKELKELED
jgi:cell fate regulator YaaT (PSP1 superfamily)